MSDIPQARDRIDALIAKTDDLYICAELQAIKRLITRRNQVRKSRAKSSEMTPIVVDRIKSLLQITPYLSYMEIASQCHVSIGRVSEVANGLWKFNDEQVRGEKEP